MADRTKIETGAEMREPDTAKKKQRSPSIGYNADVERNEQYDATIDKQDRTADEDRRFNDAQVEAMRDSRRNTDKQLNDPNILKDSIDPESGIEKGLKNPHARNSGLVRPDRGDE